MSAGGLTGGGVHDMGMSEPLSKHHHGGLDNGGKEGTNGGGVAGGGASTGGADPPPLVCVHVLCGHQSPLTAISYSTGRKKSKIE